MVGKGWTHRIDEIPAVGSEVEVVLANDSEERGFRAAVVPSTDVTFQGIGAEVGYDIEGDIVSSSKVAWWRYVS